MQKILTPLQEDFKYKLIYLMSFTLKFSIFLFLLISLWVSLDAFVSFLPINLYYFVAFTFLVIFISYFDHLPENDNFFLYKHILSERNILYKIISHLNYLIDKIYKFSAFISRPLILLPILILTFFIMQNGILLVKDWIIYANPIKLDGAVSKSIINNTNFNYCPPKLWGKDSRRKSKNKKDICDIISITYQEKQYTRRVLYERPYYINNDIYASKLFPTNMTLGYVLVKKNLILRTSFNIIITLIGTVFILEMIRRLKKRTLNEE
ncbi:hypothetical protein [Bartonella sp. HY761]|uniref:hypothetical protein n=1 Tax=Bartonella sp. HY761 TaxID=2979330 RepID=UPI0022018463|nr:hypothetical protein [Bartonella sp. HY761]UXN05542.1 hypothetical protein N6A79_09550 [Bartonella sp. HY761]